MASSTFGGSEVLPVITLRWSPFFNTTRYAKVMKFTSVWNLSFSKWIQWICFFLICFFLPGTQVAVAVCSFLGEFRILGSSSWGASYSRSRIRFEVMSPEATQKVFLPTWPSPKNSHFFGRYLKDLKVLDVKTSDFFRLFGAFLFPLTHRGPRWLFLRLWDEQRWGPFSTTLENRWSRLHNVEGGFWSWGLEAFRKAIEKAMEKIMEAILEIFEHIFVECFFFQSKQATSIFFPFQFCFNK